MKPVKVLILSPVQTHPAHRGNRQRILQIARLFQTNGFETELAIGRNRKVTGEARAFWPVIHSLKHSPAWKPTRKNVPLDAWYRHGLGEEIAAIVTRRGVDVVLLNYIFHSKLLDSLPSEIVKIIDTHDVFTNRRDLHVGQRYTGGFFSCTADDEATYLRRAHLAIAISPNDTTKFRAAAPNLPVINIPFIAHRDQSENTVVSRASTAGKKTVGLALSGNDLNLASLHSLIAAVDDQFKGNPPFTLLVAGDIYSKLIRPLPHRIASFSRPWLRYLGRVDDIYRFYREVDVIVVPVTSGSGMAIKFSEAIASDAPVLSTSQGSRGHEVTHDLHRLESAGEIVRSLGTLDERTILELITAQRNYHERAGASVLDGFSELREFIRGRQSPSHSIEGGDSL